ncbi:hypothetical protein KDD17_06215 [Sulfitobacter albidus]|uniref:Uncharacterized protein n=1 Tax=Sulfitobacter albidus TaxID=2829501 RepID=A0A975JFH6_9RHOB|nr:hypothetical protein [Sulfitobacter albidus]QUJ77564.1 hypothetical protein KDD17_06215 [Sulfitobacter albidus]
MKRLALTVLACALAQTAFADAPAPLTLDYETFEAAVPHVDLEACPEALAGEDRFCRATLAGEQLHVFAFSLASNSPLVAFQSYDATALPGLLN